MQRKSQGRLSQNHTEVQHVLCIFWNICSNSEVAYVHQCSKMNCPPFFLCLLDDLSFAPDFRDLPRWQFFRAFPTI